MKARLLRFMGNLRESYWFVPTLMALGAMLLALVMTWIDIALGSQWMERMTWLHAARPAGARSLLSAVGGSMIGVAGTTFSVTIAAVVYASGQYGPRLLSNFMGDRGNQVTLGTFIATFLYAVLVLRTIRSPGEGGSDADAFVPQLALLVAVLLVLGSVAVLIYYIHHVPRQIHINSVIEGIGRRLLREIENRFPVFVGQPLDAADADDPRIPAVFRDAPAASAAVPAGVGSEEVGYIQVVDEGTLVDAARENGLVVRMLYQPGDFARVGSLLVEAWPAEKCSEAVADRLRDAFAMGNRRTPLQDLKFPIDELVEIAARALSPGVNDPFTANSCLDWLAAAFSDLARRDLPSALRADDDGALRVIARPMSFAQLVDRAFGSLAQYVSADMIASRRFLAVVGDVALACEAPSRRATLMRLVADFRALADANLSGVNRRSVCERADDLLQALDDPRRLRRLRDRSDWLGGSV